MIDGVAFFYLKKLIIIIINGKNVHLINRKIQIFSTFLFTNARDFFDLSLVHDSL